MEDKITLFELYGLLDNYLNQDSNNGFKYFFIEVGDSYYSEHVTKDMIYFSKEGLRLDMDS